MARGRMRRALLATPLPHRQLLELQRRGDQRRPVEQQLDGGAHRPRAEPDRRALYPQNRREPARPVMDRRGYRVQVLLALAQGLRPAALPDLRYLDVEYGAVHGGPVRERGQLAGPELAAVSQEYLAHRGRVRDARAAHLGYAPHGQPALHEIESERLVLAGNRQRHGLPDQLAEFLQVVPGKGADVESLVHGGHLTGGWHAGPGHGTMLLKWK